MISVYNNRRPKIVLTAVLIAAAMISLLVLFNGNVKLTGASSGISNVVATATVKSSCYFSISNTAINYGNVNPGSSTTTSNLVLATDSGGNAAENVLVAGGNWVYGANTFYVSNNLWNPTSAAAGIGNTVFLWQGGSPPGNLVDTNILIPAPTRQISTQSNSIFFGMSVVSGTPSGIYSSNIVMDYSCGGTDGASLSYNVVLTANVQNFCYISLSNTAIAFGSINPGANVPTNNDITVSDPGGNIAANIMVDGTNWILSPDTANFLAGNTLWDATSDSTYTGNALQLEPGLVDTNIRIAAPTQANPTTSNNIYFGLGIPAGQTAGAYSQNIVLENTC